MSDILYKFQQYMSDESINLDELPVFIRKKIHYITNTLPKSAEKFISIEKKKFLTTKIDTEICHLIRDWEEGDYETEKQFEKKHEKDKTIEQVIEQTVKPAEPVKPIEKPTPPLTPVTAKYPFGTKEMEEKILESLNKDRIKTDVLKSIIGKRPETPYQNVHNIKLKAVFLGDCYSYIKE